MTRALPGRALLILIGVLAAAIVVAGVAGFATRDSTAGTDVFEQAAAALAGLAVVGMALCVRPAWPLSIGLAFGAFSGHWDTLGIPVALDRLLIGTAIVSTLVRERIRSATPSKPGRSTAYSRWSRSTRSARR